MYERKSNSGHTVEWDPEDEQLAEETLEEMKGNGIPEHVSLPGDANVEVDGATAGEIRDRYREKYEAKHGSGE